jgi:uncharacterized protein involved in tolerance to divalent cations/catechol 2,3-dioxygenase-like lactoylglutathione lyase family enzyme
MHPDDLLEVTTTCPDRASAEAIAAALVADRLAACVHIEPGIESRYRWRGRVETAREIPLLIKTRAALFEAVAAAIRARHPYETPAILGHPLPLASADYRTWILAETGATLGAAAEPLPESPVAPQARPMLDHIGIAVADMARALAFYDRALAPLGIMRVMSFGGTDDAPEHVGYGTGRKPFFWIGAGTPPGTPSGGPLHVAFAAPDRTAVDAFHAAALAAGGTDNGAPGLRPHYHPGYYGAFALDPDGNNVEAVHHGG